MNIYILLLLGSIAIPLALSFDKKLQFYKSWKYLFPAITLVSAVYIAFDVYLTRIGVWGFNPEHHSNIKLLDLPLEEWLFFFVIPYASLFLHYSIVLYFPNLKLSTSVSNSISGVLIVFFLVIIALNPEKIYTVYISIFILLFLFISLFDQTKSINNFYLTFLAILLPFILVNSILTGSFIENEVVWYNNQENLGIRFLTIPIEDFAYTFSMLGLNILVFENMRAHRLP